MQAATREMNATKFQIIEFRNEHQQGVEDLVLPIQQKEFGVPITRADQPDLIDIEGCFRQGVGNFWVAVSNDKVIGSIGVMDIGNQQLALKKMFVHRDFRGKDFGIASALMQQAKQWAVSHGIREIYLGTTSQMEAAQRFYARNGFVPVEVGNLPPAFPIVHVDTRFYRCELD